jgi:hypothetical protein
MPAVEPDPERPSSDQLVDVGTVGDDEETAATEEAPASDAVAPAPEQSEPGPAEEPKAAPTGFTGDAALLDEPDPWD